MEEVTMYRADDGTLFDDQDKCNNYECLKRVHKYITAKFPGQEKAVSKCIMDNLGDIYRIWDRGLKL